MPLQLAACQPHQEAFNRLASHQICSRAISLSPSLASKIYKLTPRQYQEGLHVAHTGERITSEEFQAEIGAVLGNFNKNLRVLKRQRRIIEQDIEDEVEHHKRERGEDQEPDVSFLERAYTNTIVPRVMGASAKQRKSKFDQKAFTNDVMEYYGGASWRTGLLSLDRRAQLQACEGCASRSKVSQWRRGLLHLGCWGAGVVRSTQW